MVTATATRPFDVRGIVGRIVFLREFGVLVAALVIAAFFGLLNSTFFSINLVSDYVATAVQYGVVGIGVSLLMIAGEFDLSVGSVYAFAPLMGAWLWLKVGWDVYPAFAVCLLIGVGVGFVNGLVVTRLGVPSFIMTLASLFFFQGLALVVTGGYDISYFGNEPLVQWLGGGTVGPFSVSVFWYLALGACLAVVLVKTRFGNWIQATGGDRSAARGMGVPVTTVKIVCFVLVGCLAAFSGLITFASFGSVEPAQGADLPLVSIVVAVVGGASLTGGQGSVVGAMIASLVLGMSYAGLVLIGAPPAWFTAFVGLVLLVAVLMNLQVIRMKTHSGMIRG